MHAPFINTIIFGGSTQVKIGAARTAGFAEIEIWREDVEAFPGSMAVLRQVLEAASIGLTDIQVLRDFDGAPGNRRDQRRSDALAMMNIAESLGSKVIQAPATTDPDMDCSRIVDDLRWLAKEARDRGLSIAYEPMAWSVMNHDLPSAWRTLQEVAEPNIGLVVDAFHIFARERTVADLKGIPAERIANVQLCDLRYPVGNEDVKQVARHRRLLPGDGYFPLRSLLLALHEIAYEGPVGIEVFNDELKIQPPVEVARKAMDSLKSTMQLVNVI